MQYEVSNPKQYIESLDEDWRKEKLLMLRQIILENATDIEEGIEYKMLRYGNDAGALFYLNAQKNYVSLYVGDTKKIDPEAKWLKGLDLGKGCIRFKKSVEVEKTKINGFIAQAISLWRQGEDVNC